MPVADRADPERGEPPESPVSGGPRPHAESSGELMLVQPALAASLRPLRRSARRWLDESGWPVLAAEDIELALNEAVANVIDHACHQDDPGPIHLHAWISLPVTTAPNRTCHRDRAGALIAAPGFSAIAISVPGPPSGTRLAGLTVSCRCRDAWPPSSCPIVAAGHPSAIPSTGAVIAAMAWA
jgi:hypothetical protein